MEEAARGIVGGTAGSADAGYRVQDLLVDPVLRKAWVRVADCHDARKPLTLVPLAASLAGGAETHTTTAEPIRVSSTMPLVPALGGGSSSGPIRMSDNRAANQPAPPVRSTGTPVDRTR